MSMTTKQRSRTESLLTRHRPDEHNLRTRQRRSGLLALAALLIVGSALAGGLLFARAGDTIEVLAVRDAVARGQAITQSNLIARNVSGVPNSIGTASADSVSGKLAAVDLVPGQLLTTTLITSEPFPGPGRALVGLSLGPERVPSAGLAAGDLVDVIAVPAGNNAESSDELDAPAILAHQARVHDVKGSATEGGSVLVTVVVEATDASRIAAYSTAGRTAIIETSTTEGN